MVGETDEIYTRTLIIDDTQIKLPKFVEDYNSIKGFNWDIINFQIVLEFLVHEIE